VKQPHEGIRGYDLTNRGDLLCLSEEGQAHRSLIVLLAHGILTATQVGNPAPIVQRIADRMRRPQAGDLVFEESTFWGSFRRGHPHEGQAWCRGFGFLLEEREEWADIDAEWEEHLAAEAEYYALDHDDPERPTDWAWYIQYGPSPEDVTRWFNCSIIAIPTDPELFSIGIGPDRGLPRLSFGEIAEGVVLAKESYDPKA